MEDEVAAATRLVGVTTELVVDGVGVEVVLTGQETVQGIDAVKGSSSTLLAEAKTGAWEPI